jgi:hypothetical protein
VSRSSECQKEVLNALGLFHDVQDLGGHKYVRRGLVAIGTQKTVWNVEGGKKESRSWMGEEEIFILFGGGEGGEACTDNAAERGLVH